MYIRFFLPNILITDEIITIVLQLYCVYILLTLFLPLFGVFCLILQAKLKKISKGI